MRIVILTDSLGRARPDLDIHNKTRYHDIYGYIIKKYFGEKHEVELCYIDDLDTEDAVLRSQRMVAYREPDIVIYHLGINDCAPRLFNKNSRSLFLNPIFRKITRNIFVRIMSRYRYRFTKLFQKTYVTKESFKSNLCIMKEEVYKYCPSCNFIAISICNAPEHLVQRSFNINKNIDKYNDVLQEVFDEGYVNINVMLPLDKLLINDGIHLTKQAHKLLAQKIIRIIGKYDI